MAERGGSGFSDAPRGSLEHQSQQGLQAGTCRVGICLSLPLHGQQTPSPTSSRAADPQRTLLTEEELSAWARPWVFSHSVSPSLLPHLPWSPVQPDPYWGGSAVASGDPQGVLPLALAHSPGSLSSYLTPEAIDRTQTSHPPPRPRSNVLLRLRRE